MDERLKLTDFTDHKRRFEAAANELNASFLRAEDAMRLRGFVTAASIPLSTPRRSRSGRLIGTEITGQLAWLQLEERWRLAFINASGVRPLADTSLTIRIAAAHALEDLVAAMMEAEE